MKIKENQYLAIEMLAMGQRPSVVAKSLNKAPETISRWQTDEEFKRYSDRAMTILSVK